MKVRVQTPSHSIRQKTLNFWNERVRQVKLREVGNKSNDLILEITIGDHITAEQLFEFGLSFSKMHLVMLNIATCGFFWYELSGQTQTYYESIKDLDAPHMQVVVVGKPSGLSKEWSQNEPNLPRRERVALEEAHLNIAIMAMATFAFMPDKEAGPIFGPYMEGLALLAKTGLHFGVTVPARQAFLVALRRAMVRFGDMKSEDEELLPALHRAMEPVIPEEVRNQIFTPLETAPAGSVGDAINAKRAADLYLAFVARRLWPEFVKRAAEDRHSPDEAA